jgi:DNA-binding transcriptional regulator YiaG
MTHAYDRALLGRAADTLGRMLDFASRSLHYDITSMMDLFCASGLASMFERGEIRVIAGMSGTELVYEILGESGFTFERTAPRHTGGLSPEYWCGYALAHIQWNSCLPFRKIMSVFSPQGFTEEYSKKRFRFLDGLPLNISETERSDALREFGERFAAETASSVLASFTDITLASPGACLRKARTSCRLSQSGLAAETGIPVRTIQQYEQGQKDLRKARSEYISAMSRVLNCSPDSLLGMDDV